MRRSKWLIQRARDYTDNNGFASTTAGVSDDEALQWLTDAQEQLYIELKNYGTGPFETQFITDVVYAQEAYDLMPDTLFGNAVEKVEYSHTGQIKDFYTLDPITPEQRDTSNTGYCPSGYLVRNGQVLLSPIPTTGILNGLRVTYIRELPRIGKRLAQVDTITAVGGVISAMSIFLTDFTNYFPDASSFSSTSILVDDYFSLVDENGNVLSHNIPISAISSTTGVCTLTSTHIPWVTDTGTSVTLDGAYLVAGTNASSHPQLPDMCEKFLIHYCAWEFFGRDGSSKGKAQATKVADILGNLQRGWKQLSSDTSHVPLTNTQWLWA